MDKYVPTFPEAWNKLCPQGWAWLIGDCGFGQNCGSCKEPEAPIYEKTRRGKEELRIASEMSWTRNEILRSSEQKEAS